MELYARVRTEREGRPFGLGEDQAVMRSTYVAPSMEEARRDAEAGIMSAFIFNDPFRGRQVFTNPGEVLAADVNLDWDFLEPRTLLVGPPENVVEKIHELEEVCHLDYLGTDFYEYGWGQSFHFAPRIPGESFAASLARHQHYLAHVLGLRTGMVAADLGCEIGGPLMEIARFSGANIVGINSNTHQIERARTLTAEAGLSHLAEYVHGDFMDVDAPDNAFDAVYAIEATCYAPETQHLQRSATAAEAGCALCCL